MQILPQVAQAPWSRSDPGPYGVARRLPRLPTGDRRQFVGQVSALACVALLGCGSIAKSSLSPAEGHARANRLDDFRISASDHHRVSSWERAWSEQRRAAGRDRVTALSLSGGGANGAFGAGVMVGWSKTGARPMFDVVTGVSTGALIAPFVFAGADWDERLRAAYRDRRLGALGVGRLRAIVRSGLAALFRSSLFDAAPLARLVAEYADESLLGAIADQHDCGRRLLVATTNLESQECVIWDLGAIAQASLRPDERGRARRLFQNVLVASASAPGFFPPTPIVWDDDAAAELHVDGGVSTPLLLAPGSITRPTDLYLVINGSLDPTYRPAPQGAIPIMMRALETMGRANARARVAAAEILAERHGASMSYAAMPDGPADSFDFRPRNLRVLFELGHDQALARQAFRSTALKLVARRPPLDRAA
jgi:predicted acylesterase/phospholipase RssA